MIKTRFAPSPTGFLHLGSLRTAIFNWLYARAMHGKFYLRIEDTDTERSFQEATDNIFETLKWMGIDYDSDPVIQSTRKNRHVEVAKELVKKGRAYYCYCSEERLKNLREKAEKEKRFFLYDRHCLNLKEVPENAGMPVIRLKADTIGKTVLHDLVQGDVTVNNSQMDDLILVRSDGNPTYMLSVVVDDHDMGITHVIRGDDHLTNTFRQIQIYKAMDWDIPEFAHIPLIYNMQGKKLSKREGTVNLREYQDIFLSDALFNYLLRLGWSHGNDEIISKQDAIKWFDIKDVGRSPARYDEKKLSNLNAHYLRSLSDDDAAKLLQKHYGSYIKDEKIDMFKKGFKNLAKRVKTIKELCISARIYVEDDVVLKQDAIDYLNTADLSFIEYYIDEISTLKSWTEEKLLDLTKKYIEKSGMKMIDLAQTIRALIAGSLISPSIFEIMEIIGKDLSLSRIMKYKNITKF